MTTKRPPSQLTLDLPMPGRGEASRRLVREVEVVTATIEPEPGIHQASDGGDL
jgi:hypothetical protein